ncbi:hypothetical protein RRG08_044797 [Elysia crispata]|uniref:WSC domain-containing protein n=1 Tax=Elysia crispata TaxID=231223 RepID=A0AAE1DM31_9GAST|nr:hypothetical protein RRG08_044797 [Elysia crispata]
MATTVRTSCLLFVLNGLLVPSLAIIGDGQCTPKTQCHDCSRTYTVDHRHIAVPQGCYKSQGDLIGNVLPYRSLSNFRDGVGYNILWEMWNCTADAYQIIGEFCGKEAVALGKKYFGVEFYGECYFGDDADLNYSQGMVDLPDCEQKCRWDVGGADTMMVYKVEDVGAGYHCRSQ